MKMVILSGSPKKEGLSRSIINEAIRAANDGGAEVQEISMNGMTSCRVCGDGWGACNMRINRVKICC